MVHRVIDRGALRHDRVEQRAVRHTRPEPAKHPDTEVLDITSAAASDSTFFAPAVIGCGPGGVANIAVDEAIDTSAGLPTASGVNSLSLSGTFQIAITSAGEDSALPQPQSNPKVLLGAFKASVGLPPSSRQEAVRRISIAEMRHSLGFK